MQDIVVYISLDTAAQEKPTLLPLILSFEGESAYKEYSSAEAVAVDFPASGSLTALAARALFHQVKLESCPGRIKKVAVYGVASDAQSPPPWIPCGRPRTSGTSCCPPLRIPP